MTTHRDLISDLHAELNIPRGYDQERSGEGKSVACVALNGPHAPPITDIQRWHAQTKLIEAGIIRDASSDAILERMVSRLAAAAEYDYEAPKNVQLHIGKPKYPFAPRMMRARAALLANRAMLIKDLAAKTGIATQTLYEARIQLRNEGYPTG